MENSKSMTEVLQNSREEAIRLGNRALTSDHFCLGILRVKQCLAHDKHSVNVQYIEKWMNET